MDTLIYFIFSFAVYIQIWEGLYGCSQSMPTISYVESCPKNKTEWNIAARRKNCDSLAAFQNCTAPEHFQYHCLENQLQTRTLEICAPIFYLQGYCARYSTDKKRVEENYESGFECLRFDESEKCPPRYPSTDVYKYQRCYKLKYQKPTQTACPICTSPSPSSEPETVTKEYLGCDTDDSVKTVFLVILGLALAGVIVFFILFYKRESPYLQRFCKVLTCDEETGPVDGKENEGKRQPKEQPNEVDERLPLLNEETGRDEKGQTSDIVTASKQEPVDDASSKPKSDYENASTKKSNTFLNSTSNLDTEGTMEAKSDDHSLSKPKPTDVSLQQVKSDAKNTSKPSNPENEPTEILIPENNKTGDKSQDANEKKFKENPPKSNDGHSLKPVSNENIASKSTSHEASDSQQVSNDKSAAVPVSASHTSSSSVSPLKSTKEDMKEVVVDDSKEIPTGMPAESPQSLLFNSSSLSKKNTSGSNAPDNSISSSDQISQNGTDVSKPILQYQAAANSTPKDVPTSDDASVSTLSTDNPAPDLSNDNPAPDSCASKPISAINLFDEDSMPSATSKKDPAPNDSTNLKPISGNNQFEEDTKPSGSGKTKPPRPPPRKIDVPRISSKTKPAPALPPPPPSPLPGQPRKS